MTDEELILAMERDCSRLLERGRLGLGTEGHRLLLSLRHAIEDDRVSRQRAARRGTPSYGPLGESLDDITASLVATVLRERRLAVQLWLDALEPSS